ncbi:MAG: TaqI-like C-terminal specificity domain-containing protein, partial [archaeon]
LKNDPAPAFQLRRYAYSAKLPVSILTDFEEFIVYDTTLKPAITDKTHVGRMLYYTYQEYIENWESIHATFSKEAVLRGNFERFLQIKQGKKPRAEIDRDFLNDLDNWRILLARNIALRNPNLSERELNYAVQFTIDRLIFLRMSEDRGIETQYPLQSLLNGERVYPRLVEIYYRADERYNSGLFHFNEKDGTNPDTITPTLTIDDKLLKEIVRNLYYPDCPYEFSVLPVEVLGNAYEQFLGKRISLTAGHHARIEEKPEVRKAGGVYYTPQYIVDYIVKNTVGKLLEGKTSAEVSELRILDPACGSGSFLLGAYQYLMDWHLEYYRKEYEKTGVIPVVKAEKGKRKAATQAIFSGKGGDWFLSTAEKKRILLNNLYGVDIDANAVEVTKLSLLLKVLENENSETLARQLGLWHERALPNLANNIKCGNSLIGPDYYEHQQANLFDEKEALRINVFDWEKEFPEIFSRKDAKNAKGFDVVIGNPPYVRQEMIGEFKEYFQKKYKVFHGTSDLYIYFIEKGINLLKENGHFSYIVANKWMRANYGKPFRQWLKNQNIEEIIDFGDLPVFKGVTTYPCILKVIKTPLNVTLNIVQMDSLEFKDLSEYIKPLRYEVDQTKLDDSGWSLTNSNEQDILDKLKSKGISLGKYVNGKIYRGVLTGLNEAFVISKEKRDELIANDPKSAELIKPFLIGKEIKRYSSLKPARYIILIPKGWTNKKSNHVKDAWGWLQTEYPAIAAHLVSYKNKAENRWDKGNYWWELRACDYYVEFEKPKLLLPDISLRGNFAFDDGNGFHCVNTAYIIPVEDSYLMGILNSKLITFIYQKSSAVFRGGYLRFIYQYLVQIPIRAIDFSDPADKARHDRMVSLVETMLALHKRLPEVNTPQEKDVIQRQIVATDTQIDKLVYQLYGLTEEEIKMVENV